MRERQHVYRAVEREAGMSFWKRIFGFLKRPPAWFYCTVWILTIPLIAGAAIFAATGRGGAASYVLYAGAAVFLGYSVYTIVRFAPSFKAAAIRASKKHSFTDHLIGDYGYRTVAFAVCSFAINVAYVIFNAVLAVFVLSVWYGALAGYYLFLSALRFGLLTAAYKIGRKTGGDAQLCHKEKLKLYRGCGIALLVLEIALAVAVTQMVAAGSPVLQTEVMAIGSAAYTFYKIGLAIYNLRKVRRYKDPVLQSFRNINLTDASVSLLALQTTLVAVFSKEVSANIRALNAVTGFLVCALTIFLGIFMIVRANRKLKNAEKEEMRDGRAGQSEI